MNCRQAGRWAGGKGGEGRQVGRQAGICICCIMDRIGSIITCSIYGQVKM